jgi:ATP adenylyltransferase
MKDKHPPNHLAQHHESGSNAPKPGSGFLWTPWRMAYVAGTGKREEGCIFCNRLASSEDIENLLLFRGDDVFAIMNLFPYNTGHIMVVPNVHVPSPEVLDPATLQSAALLMQRALRALRMALNCEGFNIGLNVGSPAGAGVAEHMHQHIVPRWTGDANFMPILSGTMVMPELLPVTYAKVRAELFRDDTDSPPVAICCFDQAGRRIAMNASGQALQLPVVVPGDDVPLWRAAQRLLDSAGLRAQLIDWAGTGKAGSGQRSGFSFVTGRGTGSPDVLRFVAIDDAIARLGDSPESVMIREALDRNVASFSNRD